MRVYCHRVASVVGLVCIRIFGYRDPAAEPLAEKCGLAFQLTNIIRDVKEDAAMGRVYLPEEDLANFGISPAELRAAVDPARFRPLLAMEAERARQYYRAGDDLMPLIDEDSQPALWVLITIYRRLLEKIARASTTSSAAKSPSPSARNSPFWLKGFAEAPGLMTAPVAQKSQGCGCRRRAGGVGRRLCACRQRFSSHPV